MARPTACERRRRMSPPWPTWFAQTMRRFGGRVNAGKPFPKLAEPTARLKGKTRSPTARLHIVPPRGHPMQALESYLSGRWSRGEGVETTLVDPVTGAELATASAKGLDLAGALAFARREGQGALRTIGYASRAKMV